MKKTKKLREIHVEATRDYDRLRVRLEKSKQKTISKEEIAKLEEEFRLSQVNYETHFQEFVDAVVELRGQRVKSLDRPAEKFRSFVAEYLFKITSQIQKFQPLYPSLDLSNTILPLPNLFGSLDKNEKTLSSPISQPKFPPQNVTIQISSSSSQVLSSNSTTIQDSFEKSANLSSENF